MTAQALGLTVGAFSTGLDVWLGIGRVASQVNHYLHIYGKIGILIPFLANFQVFQVVEEVLYNGDDAIALRFLEYQLEQIALVATTGSVVSGVATSGLNFKYASTAHWTSRFFIATSLLSGLFCVYYSMKQLRILGALITPADIRSWLRSPPERVRCRHKNRPSIKAVLILDTPRTLVAMAAISYIVGLSIYLASVYAMDLDQDAGSTNSRNVMISYFVALWMCLALYTKADLFDHYRDRNRTWLAIALMAVTLKKLFSGLDDDESCEEGLPTYVGGKLVPPMTLPRLRPVTALSSLNTTKTQSEKANGRTAPDSLELKEATSMPSQSTTISTALACAIESRKSCLESDRKLLEALRRFEHSLDTDGH